MDFQQFVSSAIDNVSERLSSFFSGLKAPLPEAQAEQWIQGSGLAGKIDVDGARRLILYWNGGHAPGWESFQALVPNLKLILNTSEEWLAASAALSDNFNNAYGNGSNQFWSEVPSTLVTYGLVKNCDEFITALNDIVEMVNELNYEFGRTKYNGALLYFSLSCDAKEGRLSTPANLALWEPQEIEIDADEARGDVLFQEQRLIVVREVNFKTKAALQSVLLPQDKIEGTDTLQPWTIVVDSSGGTKAALNRMQRILERSAVPFDVIVTGHAFSAAFMLLQFARERVAATNAEFMFHPVSDVYIRCLPGIFSDKVDVTVTVIPEESDYQRFLSALAARSRQPLKILQEWGQKERIFTATEALELGFIDRIVPESVIAAMAKQARPSE